MGYRGRGKIALRMKGGEAAEAAEAGEAGESGESEESMPGRARVSSLYKQVSLAS